MVDFAGALKDKAILVVWIGAMMVAAIKYFYESRRREVEPLGMTRSEQQKIADQEAQDELYKKLHDAVMTYHTKTAEQENKEAGDIEEAASSTEEEDITEEPRMSYSNACAICLEEFEEDETVVRSLGTGECPHIFHETCMQEVVAAAIRKDIRCIPCPCCRQPYVSTEIQARGQETQV